MKHGETRETKETRQHAEKVLASTEEETEKERGGLRRLSIDRFGSKAGFRVPGLRLRVVFRYCRLERRGRLSGGGPRRGLEPDSNVAETGG